MLQVKTFSLPLALPFLRPPEGGLRLVVVVVGLLSVGEASRMALK